MERIVISPSGFCPACDADWGLCSHANVTGYFGEYIVSEVIVSRHPGALSFIRRYLGERADYIPVLAEATREDIEGKIVYGNLPLYLAAFAAKVLAIEFSRSASRGLEYNLADMDSAGAHFAAYSVCFKKIMP